MNGVDSRGSADQGDAGDNQTRVPDTATLMALAVGSAADVVLMQDEQGRCLWVSPACADVLGWPAEHLVGRRASEFAHPDDLADLERARGAAAETGRGDVEFRFRRGDGTYHWVQGRRRDLVDNRSGVASVVTLRDADNAVATRTELEASRIRLQLVADHSRDAIVLTSDHTVDWCSPAIEDILGIPAAEMVGRDVAELVHQDDRTAVTDARVEMDAGIKADVRVRVRHRDDSWHWVDVRVAPVKDAAGRSRSQVASMRLVDAEVAAAATMHAQQVALADSERRYRLVVSNSTDAITVTDDGVLRWVSPAITNILGEEPDDLVGTQLMDRIHPDDHAALESVKAHLVASHPAQMPIKMRVRHRDGSWHWVELRVGPLTDDQGEVGGAVANWRLIDEQVAYLDALTRSEARNRELAAQLQHALDSRVVIEQAKGMVAAQRDISIDEAFEVLRAHARSRGAKLHDVANAVVTLGLRP